MEARRREFLTGAATLVSCRTVLAGSTDTHEMYGLIGKMMAAVGQRDGLIDIRLQATKHMPGCLNYIVAKEPRDENAIWITEVWDQQESYAATIPVGGYGLPIVKK